MKKKRLINCVDICADFYGQSHYEINGAHYKSCGWCGCEKFKDISGSPSCLLDAYIYKCINCGAAMGYSATAEWGRLWEYNKKTKRLKVIK